MKRKTSKWVQELMDTWLKDIDDPAVLQQFIKQIEKRQIALYNETEEAAFERLLKTYKDYKFNETIYMIRPLVTSPVVKGNPWKWYRAKMNHYWPRKKCMMLQVAWQTNKKHRGRHFIYLTTDGLKKYQPSRTEPDIRLRQQKLRSL